MKLSYIALLSVTAASLTAQTLSFGEITLVTPPTTPPTYVVNVILTTAGTANAGQVAGLQFDVNYTPAQLNVAVAVAGTAAAASKEASTVSLTPQLYNPSTTAPLNPGPGQRVILTGVGMSDSSVSSTGGPSLIADGSVATLTVQPVGTVTTTNSVLTLMNLAATTAGGTNIAAQAVPLAIGPGSSDPSGTGTLNLYAAYLVGGIYPLTFNASPNFGSGKIALNDLILELLYQTGAQGYSTLPPTCSDYFDAMDTFPADTATTRGGDGAIGLNDLILELLRQTGAQGYTILPVRPPRGEVCTGSATKANARRAPLEVRATLVLGPAEGAGTSQERVPVYLRAGRDLAQAGIAFSAGGGEAPLHFQPAPGMTPSIMYDSQPGLVAVAFLAGLDARGGDNILLGYVVGPAGSAANVRVFGTSAAGLNDHQDFEVNFAGGARQ